MMRESARRELAGPGWVRAVPPEGRIMELKDAVVVVTGAARGVGAELARAFAAAGARVVAADSLHAELDATVAGIAAAGGRAIAVAADVPAAGDVDALVDKAERQLGPIAVLINDVSASSAVGPAWECDPELWFRDVRANLFGPFLCCRAAARRMVPRRQGYILNIVSVGGVSDPQPYSSSDASSKTALTRLTESLAKELAPYGVKAFSIAPPAPRAPRGGRTSADPAEPKGLSGLGHAPDGGEDAPSDVVSRLAIDLVSGCVDQLSGRYFLATTNLDEVVARMDEILQRDRLTLRIRF
jgi:NAD(P)-dependent dehydrogenase (short-subunit alcohol dehydrogenase family)